MDYKKGDRFVIAVEHKYGTEEPLYSMTGGDGALTTVVTEKFLDSCERLLSVDSPPIRLRRTREELLQAAFARAEELREEIMKLEYRYDVLTDWLNGEGPGGNLKAEARNEQVRPNQHLP